MKCLNRNIPEIKKLIDKFGEVLSSKIIDLHEVNNTTIPTIQEAEVIASGMTGKKSSPVKQSPSDTQIEDQFKLRNEDGSRKRYSETEAFRKARKLNEENKDRPFKFKVIKIMGEKGDNRVYHAVKVVERGSEEDRFSLSSDEFAQPDMTGTSESVAIDLKPFRELVGPKGYTDTQIAIMDTYNKNAGVLKPYTVDVPIDKLPFEIRQSLEKKGLKKTQRYAANTEQGFIARRVSDRQDIIKTKNQTAELAKQQEESVKSRLGRKMGTKMHEEVNEKVLNHLINSQGYSVNTVRDMDEGLWIESALEKFKSEPVYKELMDNAKTIFAHKVKHYEDYSEVKVDSALQVEKLIKSMMKIYHQIHMIQNGINRKKNEGILDESLHVNHKPIFMIEKPFLDKNSPDGEAGKMDVFAIFSDGTAAIYDHKFTDLGLTQKKYDGRDTKELNRIYEIRRKQGLDTTRSKYNNWYYVLPDDVNLMKKEESWNAQIGRYTEMVTQLYGIKSIRQARILPVTVLYTTVDTGRKNKEGKAIKDYDEEKSRIQIVLTGNDDYGLSQIALEVEKTGDVALDRFIQMLISQKKDLIRERSEKKLYGDPQYKARIAKLEDSIQALLKDRDINKVSESIAALAVQIKTQLESPDTITFEQITNHLRDIEMFKTFITASKSEIDKLAKASTDKDNPYAVFKERLGAANFELELQTKALHDQMTAMIHSLNSGGGYMSEAVFDTYKYQKDIGEINKWVMHLRESNHPIVSLFSQLLDKINTNVLKERRVLKDKIDKINIELTKWGNSRGLKDTQIYSGIIDEKKNLIHKYINFVKDVFPDYMDPKHRASSRSWFRKNFKRSAVAEEEFQKRKVKVFEYYKTEAKTDDEYNKLVKEWNESYDIEYNDGKNNAWFNTFVQYGLEPINPSEYYTEEYKKLLKPENKPLLDFYNLYTEQMNYLAKKVDFKIKPNFIAEIRKDSVDTMVENGLVFGMKQQGINMFNFFTKHDKEDGIQTVPGQGLNDKKVPVFFTESVGADNKLMDLSKSLMIFSDFVHNYSGVKDIEHSVLSLRELMSKTQGVATNMFGQAVRDTTGKMQLKGEDNKTILEAFDTWINYYIYGEKMKQSPGTTKVVETVMSAASRKSVALNWLSATAGHINGEASLNMMAAKNSYFSKETLGEARKLSYAALKDGKTAVENSESKVIFTSMFFELSQEDLSHEKANEVSISSMRRMMSKDHAYFFQRYSDNLIENTLLTAMMMDYAIDPASGKTYPIQRLKERYKDDPVYGNYKWKSLWDSVVMKDGDFTMSDGTTKNIKIKDKPIIINPHTGEEISDKTFTDFRRKAKQMVARTKGNMSAEDIAGYKTHIVGKLVMQFRGWMPATIRERVKGEQYNLTMEQFEVGRWMAAYDLVGKNLLSTGRQLLGKMMPFLQPKMDPQELEGQSKAFKKFAGQFIKEVIPFLNGNFQEGINDEMHPLRIKYRQFIADNPHLEPDPNNPSLEQLTFEQYYNTYISEMKALAKEVQLYIALMAAVSLIMLAGGEDELKENLGLGLVISVADRTMMELGFFIPIPGLGFEQTTEMFTRKPFAAWDGVTTMLNLAENTMTETYDTIMGAGFRETVTPKLGDESWTIDYEPRPDKTIWGYYSHQFVPPLKLINSFLEIENTTKKEDTIWEWLNSGEIRYR